MRIWRLSIISRWCVVCTCKPKHFYDNKTRYSKYFISTCLEYGRKLALHTRPVHHSTFQTILTYLHILKTVLRLFLTEQTKRTHEYKQHMSWWGWVGWDKGTWHRKCKIYHPPPLSDYCVYVPNRSVSFVCLEPLSITFTSHLSNLTWYIFVWGNWRGKRCTMEVIVMTTRYSPGYRSLMGERYPIMVVVVVLFGTSVVLIRWIKWVNDVWIKIPLNSKQVCCDILERLVLRQKGTQVQVLVRLIRLFVKLD